MAKREPENDPPAVRAQREQKAVELAADNATQQEIARAVGLSQPGVCKMLKRITLRTQDKTDTIRLLSTERQLDDLRKARAHLVRILNFHSWSDARLVMAYLATLKAERDILGLDAPVKREVSGPGGGPIQVADARLEELLKHDARELARMHSEALAQSDAPQSES